jgi:hypothetical protein
VASNGQKTKVLPLQQQQRSRGQSRQLETTIIVSDGGGNESAQILLTNLPKTQNNVKAVTAPSTSVTQSTSGVMTGANSQFFIMHVSFPLFLLCKHFIC